MIYQFDDVEVDLQNFKILKGGRSLSLEPKAFEVLVFLISHRERLVEKNELLDAVWKEAFVTPNALTRVIAHLRRTLGDDAKVSRYIETVPTRGYRFVADVRTRNDAGDADVRSRPASPRKFPARGAAMICLGLLLLASAFVWWRIQTRDEWDEWPGVVKTTQITSNQGIDLYPSFSPDGGTIAYSSLRKGDFEIFVRQLARGGREIQITSDGGQNLQPVWSPDGGMIAYHSRNRRGIWMAPALGGVARQLAGFGSKPAWSRDGEWIVFQSDAPNELSQAAFGAMPPSTIWVVPARGGEPRQITQPGRPSGGHGTPAWSPDGKRIAFIASDIGLSEIWSISSQGDDLKRIWRGQGNFFDAVYSPDGRYLYVSAASGNFRLWRLRMSAETGLLDGEPAEIINTGASLARHLTVSPDGKRIACSLLTMINNIGSVRVSKDSYEAVGDPIFLTQDTNYRKTNQFFSPDGKTIAYSVWRMGAEGEVWLIDADGGNPRQITTEPAAVLGWLPSGNEVALVPKASLSTVLKVDAAAGRQILTTIEDRGVRFGRLSPDGKTIAFNSRASGTINVWSIALESKQIKQLTFDRELMGFPSWSPDNRRIAFEMKRGDDTHIAVIPREGGEITQLTFDRGQSWPNSWAPDGDKIAFAGERDGVWNLWWVSRATKRQKRLTDNTKLNVYIRYPAWSPLGDQIIYEYAETQGNVWLMELK